MLLRLLVLAASSTILVNSETFRGVSPDDAHLYAPSEQNTFKCFDSGKEIPFKSVNDDYCDCLDGSDEPGTSACSKGKFYCENKGYKPVFIKRLKVNDGVCDEECCDGSDEWLGLVKCPNTCEAFQEIVNKRRQELVDKMMRGAKLYEEYASFGELAHVERTAEIQRLKVEIKDISEKLGQLEVAKNEAADYEQKLRDNNPDLEKQRQIATYPLLLEKYKAAFEDVKAKYHTLDKKCKALLENVQILQEAVEKENKHERGTPLDGEFDKDFQKNTNENLEEIRDEEGDAYRSPNEELIDRGLEGILEEIKDLASYAAEPLTYDFKVTVPEEQASKLHPCDDVDAPLVECLAKYKNVIFSHTGEFFKVASKVYKTLANALISPNWDEEFQALRKDFQKASQKQQHFSNKKMIAVSKLDALKAENALDFGPRRVFGKLANKTFTYISPSHKYEFVFFDTVKQMNKDSSYGGTNLGKFSRWGRRNKVSVDVETGVMKGYHSMMYENGDVCPNGIKRSVQVEFKCGNEDDIVSVKEPSICEYEMKMTTPAVCDVLPKEETEHAREEL